MSAYTKSHAKMADGKMSAIMFAHEIVDITWIIIQPLHVFIRETTQYEYKRNGLSEA